MRLLSSLLALLLFGCSDPNDPPTITFLNELPESVDHNRQFQFFIKAEHSEGRQLEFSVKAPTWVTFDETLATLSGTPDWLLLTTSFRISITATDGSITSEHESLIKVNLGEIICNVDFGDPDASPYRLPYEVGKRYQVNQTYCPDNPNWGHHNWFAYDFKMPMNTPLLASRAGRVIATRSNNPDGTRECGVGRENFVFIEHEDKTVATYVHIIQNGVEVQKGDFVEQGQLIGYSGDSGCSSGPHLHMALFRDRSNYNRQYTLPFNFNNALGELDRNRGLMQDGQYEAAD